MQPVSGVRVLFICTTRKAVYFRIPRAFFDDHVSNRAVAAPTPVVVGTPHREGLVLSEAVYSLERPLEAGSTYGVVLTRVYIQRQRAGNIEIQDVHTVTISRVCVPRYEEQPITAERLHAFINGSRSVSRCAFSLPRNVSPFGLNLRISAHHYKNGSTFSYYPKDRRHGGVDPARVMHLPVVYTKAPRNPSTGKPHFIFPNDAVNTRALALLTGATCCAFDASRGRLYLTTGRHLTVVSYARRWPDE